MKKPGSSELSTMSGWSRNPGWSARRVIAASASFLDAYTPMSIALSASPPGGTCHMIQTSVCWDVMGTQSALANVTWDRCQQQRCDACEAGHQECRDTRNDRTKN